MKKIGIMGGTFNPIHNGHLRMAQAAYEQYELDEVWFMPSKNPPHKKKSEIASDEHRERMVRFAIDGIPHFSFSDMELKREGTTYTCETLEEIHKKHPKYQLYFILGGDSLADFDKWFHPELILKHAVILAAPRGDFSTEDMLAMCREKAEKYHGNISLISMEHIQISSEKIRNLLENKKSILSLCPSKVEWYIHLHGLYGCPLYDRHTISIESGQKKELLLQCLSSTLRPKRYLHTIGVAQTAAALAFCHLKTPEEIWRAELAGMLHDCAKYLTGEEMIRFCQKKQISLSAAERENTALIHGKLGAFFARERYGIRDEEILSAIRYHTTGKPEMTTLEKIIYIADYIEPGRRMNCSPHSLEEIRETCFRNLDAGLLMILTNTVEYLQQTNKSIDEMSFITYHYYQKEWEMRNGK